MSKHQTLLGFDFGTKNIGTAVGQTITKSARALKTLSANNGEPDWEKIAELIDDWHPTALIVGIAYGRNHEDVTITHAVKHFAKALADRFSLPVHLVDEHMTTKEAKQQIFDEGGFKALEKADIDCIAAKLILEQFMSGLNNHD